MVRQDILQSVRKVLAIAIPLVGITFVLDIPLYLTATSLFNQQYLALFWCLITALIFLTMPASKKATAKGPKWYDILLAGLTLFAGFYVAIFYGQILLGLGTPTVFQAVLGCITLMLVLESTRRVSGLPLVTIILVFVLYAKFGNFLPGILYIKGLTWARLFSQLYLGADFMFGIPLRVACLIVFGFIFFGQVLFKVGGGEFFIGLAMSLMGKYRGGPAKVAVLASTLFGTISGSAVANVAGTGIITIPLMKRSGYSETYAGAVEATSSTGGQILPPVMGAAAFIMAEFLGVSYPVVVVAAVVPALLYYLGVFMQVHLQAVSKDLKGLPAEKVPSFRTVIREGWVFLIPVVVLVFALFVLFMPPGVAALYSLGAVVAASFLKGKTRHTWTWAKVLDIFQGTSRAMFELIAICAASGFIIGIVSYTGLGLSMSRLLTEASGSNLLLLAMFTAVASTILGMGMPTAAAYILLAVLAAPALVNLGVEPIVAHLFVFYFGTLSMLTPPVCLAAYAAASIAETSPVRLALRAMRLAIAGYLVPFILLYNPGLAFIGSTGGIIQAIFFTAMAIALFAFCIEGWLLHKLNLWERVLSAISAIAIVVPSWPSRLAGLVIAALLLFIQFRKKLGLAVAKEASMAVYPGNQK